MRVDDFGRWRCSFRPTWGDKKTRKLTARSGAELVQRVEQVLEEKPKKRGGAGE